MKIKRLLAGSLATLAAGATLLAAVGAVTLSDFVTVTDSTMSSPYLVVGDAAAAADTLAAADIGVALAGYATKDVTVPGVTATSVTGGVLVTSDLNKTYIGKAFNTAKTTLTSTDLPTLLASKEFTDKNATTITYSQQIGLGSQSVAYGKPSEFTEPALYVTLGSATPYTLKVIFMGGLDTDAVDSTYKITLFGKEYTFGATHTNTSLELYSSTGAQIISLSGVGDEKTTTVDTTSYTFKLLGWGHETATNQGVFLTVNGAAPSPAEWLEGSTYTIPGTTIKVLVNDVSVISTGGTEKSVSAQLFVGTDKLELVNATAVEKNDVALVNTQATFESSGAKINTLTISVAPDIDTYLKDGSEFVDPVIGSFKFALKDMTPSLTATARDAIQVAKTGTNQVKLTFTNKDSIEYAVNAFYYDTTTGWERTIDGTHELWVQEANTTSGANNITLSDYFVVTNAANKASYIYKYSSYYPSTTASLRYVTLTDVKSGTSQKVYYTTDPYLRIGDNTFKIQMLGYGSDYSIGVDLDASATITEADKVNIYTKGEAIVNLSSSNQNVLVTENPLYTITGSNEPSTATINVSAAYSANDVGFGVAGVTTYQVGTANQYKGVTAYGTYVERDTDADTVKIYVPGNRPANANVAVGSAPVISTEVTAAGVYKEAIPIKNSISKLVTEIDKTAIDRDLILLGGPCVNSLVGDLLNMSTEAGTCYTEFIAAYPNTGVIKVVENAFDSGKKALIVAGVDRAKTRELAVDVMQGTLEKSG